MNFSLFTTTCCIDILVFFIILIDKFQKYYKRELLGIHDPAGGQMVAIILNGFLTGLILQIAIGPVFFFILNISLQKTVIDGLFAVIAVTLVDYIFIALAVLGVGKLLERQKRKRERKINFVFPFSFHHFIT